MFNRQPFNRGKFNRTISSTKSVLLHGNIGIQLKAAGQINATKAFDGEAALNLSTMGKLTYSANFIGSVGLFLCADGALVRTQNMEGHAATSLVADGVIIRAQNISGSTLLMLTAASRTGFNTFRYEQIYLPNLVIRQGDELVIDTDSMTVTLNGQSVMRFLSRDSEFFLLNPSDNEITYEAAGGNNSEAEIRILWKDAWL